METIVRTPKQIGAGLRRHRRRKDISQTALAERMHARQATISRLEAGEHDIRLRTLMDALAALDLELVIRPRTKASAQEIEDIF